MNNENKTISATYRSALECDAYSKYQLATKKINEEGALALFRSYKAMPKNK